MADTRPTQMPEREIERLISALSLSDLIGGLSNMANIGEMLVAGQSEFSAEEAGQLIMLQSDRLAKLVDSIALTQQLRNGQFEIQTQPLVLNPLLDEVIAELGPMLDGYSAKLRLGRKKLSRPVLADTRLITSVLRNALEGVIRTTQAKKIRVDTISHDEKMFVHITDKYDKKNSASQGSSHSLSTPSFYVASTVTHAMNGEFRVSRNKQFRHIDIVLPHSVQLSLEFVK